MVSGFTFARTEANQPSFLPSLPPSLPPSLLRTYLDDFVLLLPNVLKREGGREGGEGPKNE